jgi:hypothetical protein
MSYRGSVIEVPRVRKIKRSNLRMRSNVFLRDPAALLRDDRKFLQHVRGLSAIRKLLGCLGLQPAQQRYDDPEVLSLVQLDKLTRAQQNALKWELACSRCNSIPCGVNFRGEFEFRCERADCTASQVSQLVARRIPVPREELRQSRQDPCEILEQAINRCRGIVPEIDLRPPFHPLPIRIRSDLDHLYNDQQLAKFLVYGILHNQTR